jgi:hypothetical protein
MYSNIAEVVKYLRPNGGYTIVGFEFEGIEFIQAEPFTKQDFENAILEYGNWKTEQAATKAAEKAALLLKLGITEDEARLLLS